jgi:hypothetical protein
VGKTVAVGACVGGACLLVFGACALDARVDAMRAGARPGTSSERAASLSPSAEAMKLQDASLDASLDARAFSAAAATCAAADLALPERDAKVVAEPLPEVIDEAGNLAPFHARMLAVARKTARDHVRIAMFGDSNMTMDFITGGMRRVLQAKYGDAGHGFVAFSRPWNWYRHRDVRHEIAQVGWKMLATSTHQVADGHYGLANIAASSLGGGAWAYAETAGDAAPTGKTVSHFDLFYLADPQGGTFTVRMDGKDVEDISTREAEVGARAHRYDVPDGPHRIGITTKTGAVRMYGTSMERDGASVVVDSFGTGALNYEQLLHVTDASRVPFLQRRNYDLVIFMLGTNMFAPEFHGQWVKGSIERFRLARADLPILIFSPPDMQWKWNDEHSDARIVKVAAQLKQFAAESKVGFWDFRGAMGGDGAMRKFAKAHLAEYDLIHFNEAGGLLMGQTIAHMLTRSSKAYGAVHEGAGCTDSHAGPPEAGKAIVATTTAPAVQTATAK